MSLMKCENCGTEWTPSDIAGGIVFCLNTSTGQCQLVEVAE